MNFEQLILSFMDRIGQTDFNMVIKMFGFGLIAFWFVVLIWVFFDAKDRSKDIFFRIFAVLLVGLLNVVGLIIYVLIRPKITLEENYWAELERRYLKFETMEMGDCPRCKYNLQPGFIVCPNCEYKLKEKCNNCSQLLDPKWYACPYCGQTRIVHTQPSSSVANETSNSITSKAPSRLAGQATNNQSSQTSKQNPALKVPEKPAESGNNQPSQMPAQKPASNTLQTPTDLTKPDSGKRERSFGDFLVYIGDTARKAVNRNKAKTTAPEQNLKKQETKPEANKQSSEKNVESKKNSSSKK